MKLTAIQLRNIIKEEIESVVTEGVMPDVDLTSLSMAQLNKLISAAKQEKESRLASGRKGRVEDALVPIDEVPFNVEVKAADRARFTQFFTRKTAPGSKRPTADTYAKTRSGLLFKWNDYYREWQKVEG